MRRAHNPSSACDVSTEQASAATNGTAVSSRVERHRSPSAGRMATFQLRSARPATSIAFHCSKLLLRSSRRRRRHIGQCRRSARRARRCSITARGARSAACATAGERGLLLANPDGRRASTFASPIARTVGIAHPSLRPPLVATAAGAAWSDARALRCTFGGSCSRLPQRTSFRAVEARARRAQW